ncbi:MAG: alpha/beta fold hydrolase [Candidatus Eremiobacteraeota bacterium]|nr:alpha/beta fold hydrolase [Candidatus Eremiobacteraeota bacterium]
MMQVFGDDGARLDVRVDGSGAAAVVLIHGFPLTRDIWHEQAETLARTHRTIRPDLRGMGSSRGGDGPYLMETLAGDVAATLDAVGIERAAIVGHSLGGYVALAFARMFSERLTHLALICSRLAADTETQASSRRELADRIEASNSVEPAIEAYVPRLIAEKTALRRPELVERVREFARATSPHGAAAMLRGMAMRDPGDDIAPDISVPVLVVAGGDDAIVAPAEAQENARAFRHGQFVCVEGSGHLPMLEVPGKLTEALSGLLARS